MIIRIFHNRIYIWVSFSLNVLVSECVSILRARFFCKCQTVARLWCINECMRACVRACVHVCCVCAKNSFRRFVLPFVRDRWYYKKEKSNNEKLTDNGQSESCLDAYIYVYIYPYKIIYIYEWQLILHSIYKFEISLTIL